MYKLIDRQGTGAMQDVVFKNKRDVLKRLRSYHQDVEGVERLSLDDLLEVGNWELIETPLKATDGEWDNHN